MKRSIFLLSFLLLIFLSACGSGETERLKEENGDLREQIAALEEENAALQERVSALEEENDQLSLANDLLGQDLAAAQDALEQLEARQEENPIDPFYDEMDKESDGTTVAMSAVANARANTWEAEARNVAECLKSQLPLQEDQDLVDAYIAAVEEQVERIYVMVFYSVSDVDRPHSERMIMHGSLWGILWGERRADIWRDTFYQLYWVMPDSLAVSPSYTFIFDPENIILENEP